MKNLQTKCNINILQRKLKTLKLKKIYCKYKPLMYGLTNTFTYKYNLSKTDLLSISYAVFWDVYNKWFEHPKFNLILKKAIINNFIMILKKKIKRQKMINENIDIDTGIEYKRSFKIKNYCFVNYDKNFTLESLSKEAKEIIETIKKAPDEIITCKNKITKQSLTKYFRNKGWNYTTIFNSFEELTSYTKEVLQYETMAL